MGKFEDLILRPGNPVEVQANARRELPMLLAQSNLHLWQLGDPIQTQGTRFLIGIAVWSVYDMRLLDALDQVLSGMRRPERVDVFNADDCSTTKCFEDYVPQIGQIYQTPVIGTWEDGSQVDKNSGAAARVMVAKHFGIDHKQLMTLPWSKI